MSVDVRSREDGPHEPLAAGAFFADVLPAALARSAELLAPAVARLDPPPLTVEVTGSAWLLQIRDGRVTVEWGSGSGGLVLRCTAGQLDDLARDQATPMAWFSSGTLDLNGRLERLLDWWLLVRGALDAVAPYVGGLRLDDGSGPPVDPAPAFSLDDDDAELAAFLERAGFLHVAGVFSEEEMAAVSADMDRLAPTYSMGDGRSWWARTADGTDRLVRMQGFESRSPAVAGLLGDGRLDRFAGLTGDGHALSGSSWKGLEALVKPIGVVQGISDVPWHRDCSLGRHSYECCSLTVGISVTGADRDSGQLRVVAGSHRTLGWPAFVRPGTDLPVVDLPTRTGDVTVHLSCTLHMAQPPVANERRVLYTGLPLPARSADPEALARLRAVREAAAVTVSQPPSPVRR
jgi:hypothetical protein